MRKLHLSVFIVVSSAILATSAMAKTTPTQAIESGLRAAVVKTIADASVSVRIDSVHVQRQRVLSRAVSVRSVQLLSKRPYGKVTARADLKMNDGRMESVLVSADVTAQTLVWVVKHPLGRGAPLSPWSVKPEYKRLSQLGRRTLRASVPLVGKVAGRSLARGTMLTSRMVTTPQLVQRSALVNVVSRVGQVVVQTAGKAIEAGRMGDLIRVRLNGSGRLIRARVTGLNRVRVL
jgi:flagella basal body P-ring formation protein FlgA